MVNLADTEKSANSSGKKSVDFYHERSGTKIWFELVSVDINDTIKQNIEQQHANSKKDGISFHEVLITSDHPDIHYDHAGQLIRLQEKILEKPSKFSQPTDNTFNIIVVDCSQIHSGGFDDEDFRNLVYGYAKNSIWQEHIKGDRMKGLLEEDFNRRHAQELQNKASALICVKQLALDLFSKDQAYVSCNPLLGSVHYHKAIAALHSINPLGALIYIKPIKPQANDTA